MTETGDRGPPRARTASERRAIITELMAAHGQAVFGFCMRVVRVLELAQDVVQQVFQEAYRDLDRFAERSSPRAWLFGIASHRCLDALKRQQRRLQVIENDEKAVLAFEDPRPRLDDHVDRARLIAALEECLDRLSPDVRATVLLRFQAEATYEEMVGLLGASSDTLRVRVVRALPLLRRCLERKGWRDE